MSTEVDPQTVEDAKNLVKQILAPCEGADEHSWRKCKRCAAIHGVEERFSLSMRLLESLLRHVDALSADLSTLRAELDKERRAHEQTIDERDAAQEAADKLAYAIAPIEAIGEHSNLNNPWENALDEIESIKERAEAWGLLNQMRESDQKAVIAARAERDAARARATELETVLRDLGMNLDARFPPTAEEG